VDLRGGVEALTKAGVPSPRADAEVLAAHVLGIPRSRLVLAGPPDPQRFAGLIARRANREPLQHLTGTAPFRHLEVQVGPGVFVPRPESELLVEHALALRPAIAVDLCAGSGALGLALAQEVPGCVVHAVEVDPVAYGWLQRNSNPQVHTHLAAVAGCLPELDAQVDVVLANPPYLLPGVVLEPEAAQDPALALYGGGAGALDQVRECVAAAVRLLRPGGLLALEHDASQAQQVLGLLEAAFTGATEHRDLTGRPRFVVALRCGHEAELAP
jgi:release factor glutamine methyltransferase